MPTADLPLDKISESEVAEGLGTIAIRVVVLSIEKVKQSTKEDVSPADLEPGEMMPEPGKKPVSTFLEGSKGGKQCCVFLINGQRQHTWDNEFITTDLELKYLRNRMIIVVDCDGLKPESIARLMQGDRKGFFEGEVYSSLEARVIAILKGDPDLRRLEEEAEDAISSLKAGDEVVKAALDELIEAHHDAAPNVNQGKAEKGKQEEESGQIRRQSD